MQNKILIFYNIFTNGGGETNLLNILQQFKGKYNFTIAIKRYNKNTHLYRYIKDSKIKVVTASLPNPMVMSKIKLFWSLFIWPLILGLKKYDVIISLEFSKATPFYKYFYLKKNGKFVWSPIGHPHDISKAGSKYKKFLKYIDEIVVETEIHKSTLELLFNKNKITVIPSYCFNSFKLKPLRKYESNSIINIGYVGRYDKNKGILELLDLFNEIIKTDINLLLSYFGNHGDSKEELKEKVKKLGLQDKVFIHSGWNNESEYENILEKLDFIVLLSKSEGLPLVLLESMAFGNPFVSTNVGAIDSLAKDNPNVIIVDDNYYSIFNGLTKMIKKIRNNEINGADLRKYYFDNFGPHNIIQKWENIFTLE